MCKAESRIIASLFAVVLCETSSAQLTERVSVGTAGVESDNNSDLNAISADGRHVAFASDASNLVAGDTNGVADIFVRDRQGGTTERVSLDSAGVQANSFSYLPSISADGRFVAFGSPASNLVAGDANGVGDIFVRDRVAGTTVRVSVATGGTEANSDSFGPSISADGRFLAFYSLASNLVAGDTNAHEDVFVRDVQSGVTEIASVDSAGVQGNGDSYPASISADGRLVAFGSYSSNLVAGDMNGVPDIFVRDRQSGTTERLSVDSAGVEANDLSLFSSISGDGRFVTFSSRASNLVANDANGSEDVFLHDRVGGTTELVSFDSAGMQGNTDSYASSISADGRFVVFVSPASNLAPGDTNGVEDVFVRDRQSATTECMSVDAAGMAGNSASLFPSISADARFVAFASSASNLVAGDTNAFYDVFERDRIGGTNFTSLCDPGVDGVIGCPCSNPPGGGGRGCDNSAATGGAVLSASGMAALSGDTLVFATSGEIPAETSIVVQGRVLVPGGLVYGQGVRCVAGPVLRLYVKTASGGSITAPDFGAGDPTVSARSAARGDVIQSGQSRWYFVYYRDGIVLGSCPSTSTFSATQTGRVDWAF